MSSVPIQLWTRCPVCRSKYLAPPEAIGHHARCRRCQARFRVEEDNPHPTEDDILRWLNEGMEEYDPLRRPRIISGSASPRPAGSAPGICPAPVVSAAAAVPVVTIRGAALSHQPPR